MVFWVLSATVLAVLVFGVLGVPGPLDDPNEGDQRAALLIDIDEAQRVEELGLPGSLLGRRAVVVIFDRRVPRPQRLREFTDEVPAGVAVVLVVPQPVEKRPADLPARVRLLTGCDGRVAQAVGMPEPRNGDPPVGYALIDEQARVRYATLDPHYAEHGFEIDIIAGALK